MWKAERAGVDWKFLSGGLRPTAEAPPAMQRQSVTVTKNLHDQFDGNDDDDGDNDDRNDDDGQYGNDDYNGDDDDGNDDDGNHDNDDHDGNDDGF